MKKLKKQTKLLIGILHLSLPLFLAGCTSNNNDADTSDNSGTTIQNDDDDSTITQGNATINEDDNDSNTNKLAGTCPKGLHCGAVGRCGLYTDSNDNNACDRGE